MKEFSIPMALVDYIPVLFFGLGVRIIAGEVYAKQRNGKGLLFLTGAGLVIAAGFLKATYKLLYALGIGDFVWMSNQFFSNQAFGFLLAGIALVLTAVKGNRTYAFLPTMALVGIMKILIPVPLVSRWKVLALLFLYAGLGAALYFFLCYRSGALQNVFDKEVVDSLLAKLGRGRKNEEN